MSTSGINRLQRPDESSYLNPNHNIWGCLKRMLRNQKETLPRNEMDLFLQLKGIWNSLFEFYFREVGDSKIYRVEGVKSAKGISFSID